MKSTISQPRHFSLVGRKVVTALAFASLISGLSIAPVLAAGDDDYGWGAQRGDHGQRGNRRGDHGQRGEWRGEREDYYGYRPEYRRPYTYAQPVYVPPPVYYEPRQSPGISLFFPLDLRW